MRYLVTWKTVPVPPEMAKTAAAMVEAAQPWIENEKKAGRIIEIAGYTEGRGGVAIVEYESNDALYAKLMENPFTPFAQYCITPLSDWNLVLESAKQLYKKIAGA